MLPQMGYCDGGSGVPSRERAARGWDTQGENPHRRLLVEMTAAPRASFSPLRVSCLSYNLATRGTLGENPVQTLDE